MFGFNERTVLRWRHWESGEVPQQPLAHRVPAGGAVRGGTVAAGHPDGSLRAGPGLHDAAGRPLPPGGPQRACVPRALPPAFRSATCFALFYLLCALSPAFALFHLLCIWIVCVSIIACPHEAWRSYYTLRLKLFFLRSCLNFFVHVLELCDGEFPKKIWMSVIFCLSAIKAYVW